MLPQKHRLADRHALDLIWIQGPLHCPSVLRWWRGIDLLAQRVSGLQCAAKYMYMIKPVYHCACVDFRLLAMNNRTARVLKSHEHLAIMPCSC